MRPGPGLLAAPAPGNTSGDFAGLIGTDGFVELPPEPDEFPGGHRRPVLALGLNPRLSAGGAAAIVPPMLTHIDAGGRPGMVDVGGKPVTRRTAHAVATVVLPPGLAEALRDGDIRTAKGPVFQTAILAGTMGAKRTSDLIPLCHPLPLDDCRIEIETLPKAPDGSVQAASTAGWPPTPGPASKWRR